MKKWYIVALFNLVILALLGLILRYKINFPLPFIKQENLLHAHSHFAFNGWISFLLQLLILEEFTDDYNKSTKFWNRLFLASTIVSYAMIVSFARVGYAGISIVLSTAAVWLSYVFAYKIYKTLPWLNNKNISTSFVKASLFFLLLSSLGPYALAILIVTKSGTAYWSHNALYFFLHFQYNGWFTLAVLAFLFKKLEASEAFNRKKARIFFIILAATCVPSYLFTSLWHQRPVSIIVIIVITAILQAAALYFLWKLLYKNMSAVYTNLPVTCRWLYSLAISAFILKVLLQFFSVQPQIAQLAFGFRPIIIGYLHLIFLVFISMYLLAFMADKKIIDLRYKVTSIGLVTFAMGIIINEILLSIQGFAAIYYLYLPKLNLFLFANTFILVSGAVVIFVAATKTNAETKQFTMTQTPIKRSKNLVELSKDHHEGLLVVWKIRQGLRFSVANKRIADFVLYAFDKHLEPHFTQEEELLFDKLPNDDQLLMKAMEQHAAIRKMVIQLGSTAEPEPAQLEAFANLLEEHIRFEERALFPHIERIFSNETMAAIGSELELIHSKQQPLYWNDQFWIRK